MIGIYDVESSSKCKVVIIPFIVSKKKTCCHCFIFIILDLHVAWRYQKPL